MKTNHKREVLKRRGAVFKRVREGYGVQVWKAIKNEWEGIKRWSCFSLRNERRLKFLKVLWCKDLTLEEAFPNLFSIASDKDE